MYVGTVVNVNIFGLITRLDAVPEQLLSYLEFQAFSLSLELNMITNFTHGDQQAAYREAAEAIRLISNRSMEFIESMDPTGPFFHPVRDTLIHNVSAAARIVQQRQPTIRLSQQGGN